MMKNWLSHWHTLLRNRAFVSMLSAGLLLLLVSLWLNVAAGDYATAHESNYVTDVVLSNTRVYDVDFVFDYGSVIFWIFVIALCVLRPKSLPFVLKSVSLFIIIRCVFISITHLAPYPNHIWVDPTAIVSKFTFGGDLFFSGHTGLPFLFALIFWRDIRLRAIFLGSSILFGAVVLLGHLHYSIDVLAAFFITYSIYHLATTFFAEEYKLLSADKGLPFAKGSPLCS